MIINQATNEELTYNTILNRDNVIDLTIKIQQREEKKKKAKMYDYFLKNIIPFMSHDEHSQLSKAMQENDSKKADAIWNKIIVSTSIRRAKSEL